MPFDLARFAALRFVLEVLLVVKLLLTRGKDKVRTAVHTLQNPVLKILHGTILGRSGALAIRPALVIYSVVPRA